MRVFGMTMEMNVITLKTTDVPVMGAPLAIIAQIIRTKKGAVEVLQSLLTAIRADMTGGAAKKVSGVGTTTGAASGATPDEGTTTPSAQAPVDPTLLPRGTYTIEALFEMVNAGMTSGIRPTNFHAPKDTLIFLGTRLLENRGAVMTMEVSTA